MKFTTPIQSINIDNVLPLLDKVLETQESIIEDACWRFVNNSTADLMFWLDRIIDMTLDISRVVDSATLEVFSHQSWNNITRLTLSKFVQELCSQGFKKYILFNKKNISMNQNAEL